jgi:hypothetical protein
MWQQWLLKSRNGALREDNGTRGPAPPAAVATAAKIALSSLGGKPEELFQTELHEKPLAERAPIEPAGSALLERSESGTLSVPLFTVSSEVNVNDFVDGESKIAAMANRVKSPHLPTVRNPLENPERRNRNLQWLRLHFRSLNDVGRLPFHNADLWQLHQYYFSPPCYQSEDDNSAKEVTGAEKDVGDSSDAEVARAPPPTPALPSNEPISLRGTVSFQSLGGAFAASGVLSASHGHKRGPSLDEVGADNGPAAKRPKNLKPRIAYYPRIMVSIVVGIGTKESANCACDS